MVGFDHFHRLQREMMGMADCLIFDSEMDREYASRFFPDIIRPFVCHLSGICAYAGIGMHMGYNESLFLKVPFVICRKVGV